jgi:hypothetical protein
LEALQGFFLNIYFLFFFHVQKLGKFNQNSLAELVETTQEKQNFPKKFKLLYRKMAKFRQKKINGKHSFFWQFLFNCWSGNDPHEDLARLGLQAQYESNF